MPTLRPATAMICGDQHKIIDQGEPVVLACSASVGHLGLHQAYYLDRLHEWP